MSAYITDHARVRYLERVKGIDMDLIRAEMTSPTIEMVDRFGRGTDCSVILTSGHRAEIKGGVVQTALPKRRGAR